LKHTVPVIIDVHVLQTFYTTWVRGVAYQEQLFAPKLTGSGLGQLSKDMRPLLISAAVEATATSNVIHNLGLGSSLPRNNF